jgi:hypothetical protein
LLRGSVLSHRARRGGCRFATCAGRATCGEHSRQEYRTPWHFHLQRTESAGGTHRSYHGSRTRWLDCRLVDNFQIDTRPKSTSDSRLARDPSGSITSVVCLPEEPSISARRSCRGTLDPLILRTLVFGPLYAAPQQLEARGAIAAKWGTSDNDRKARSYRLTRKGRRVHHRGKQVATARGGNRRHSRRQAAAAMRRSDEHFKADIESHVALERDSCRRRHVVSGRVRRQRQTTKSSCADGPKWGTPRHRRCHRPRMRFGRHGVATPGTEAVDRRNEVASTDHCGPR